MILNPITLMVFVQEPSRHNNGAIIAVLVAVLAAVVGGSAFAKRNKKQ